MNKDKDFILQLQAGNVYPAEYVPKVVPMGLSVWATFRRWMKRIAGCAAVVCRLVRLELG